MRASNILCRFAVQPLQTEAAGRRKALTDRELIRKARCGNHEAMNAIAEKYYDDIFKFCLYMTGNEADSYDISQEVFLRFIKYFDSFSCRNLKGYLLIIARNLCHDYFYRVKREHNLLNPSSEPDPHLKSGQNLSSPENTKLENAELRHLLHDILKQLPREQQEVIILRIGEELKFKEIAQILGCSQSTAKSRYRLAIARLRKEMTDDEN